MAGVLAGLLAATPAAAQEPYVERIPGTVVSFEMVPVPGGTVTIGGESVEVGPFWIARTETTWDLYDVYVFELDREARTAAIDAVARPTRPYVLPGDEFGHAGMPALGMTMHAAREFARWLSARTGKEYRVPTEAQWEHACRLGEAGSASVWTRGNTEGRTHEAGSGKADAIGVFDLRGNVAEWTRGFDGDSVIKGGSFDRPAADAECASRRSQTRAWNATDPQLPKSRWWLPDAPFVGLRLIRIPDASTETGDAS